MTQSSIQRTLLYTASGANAGRLVSAELARLEDAYLKAAKRKLPADVLSISSWGSHPKTSLGIVAYTTADQEDVLEFLQASVAESTPLNSSVVAA